MEAAGIEPAKGSYPLLCRGNAVGAERPMPSADM
jgi:hypothetical protein